MDWIASVTAVKAKSVKGLNARPASQWMSERVPPKEDPASEWTFSDPFESQVQRQSSEES